MARAIVLIPGIMGSELWLGQDLIWPGDANELLLPYGKMAELLRPDLRVGDVIRSFSISQQYGALIEDLDRCGFSEAATPPTLVVLPYDWRKSNGDAATALATKLDEVVTAHGGDVELLLLAHSMGGLVSRCYLESGDFDGRPAFAKVKWLITLGTPHRGAPLALSAAMGREKRLFLNKDQVLQVASDVRYPSLYELMPPAGEPFAWNDKAQATYEPLDVYDATIAAKLGLVAANLQAAKNFRAKLRGPRANVRYFTFVGNQQESLTAARLLDTGSTYQFRAVDTDEGGDGTVPIWSAMLQGIQMHLVGGEHGTLYKNSALRSTLAILLGQRGVLLAAGDIDVSVRDRVVHPSAIVPVVLGFHAAVQAFDGELRLEGPITPTASPATAAPAPVAATIRIAYSGPDVDTLSVRVRAPRIRGVYRVALYEAPANTFLAADDLFVQQP